MSFQLQELVHPDIYEKYGKDSMIFLDKRMVDVISMLNIRFKGIIINNWNIGGKYKDSGLRTKFGATGSMHRNGSAFDLKFLHNSIDEVYKYIMEHHVEYFNIGLRRIENPKVTKTWLHLDNKPAPMKVEIGEIYVFNP